MTDDLCARGLHPRRGDGPCEKCAAAKQGKENRCKQGHDLSLPGATYAEKDGKTRCAECRKARRKKARLKRRRAAAEAERGVEDAPPPVEDTPTFAVPPRGFVSNVDRALLRHAVIIRKSRGLM